MTNRSKPVFGGKPVALTCMFSVAPFGVIVTCAFAFGRQVAAPADTGMSKENFFANAGGEAARSAEETSRLAQSEPCEMRDMFFLHLGVRYGGHRRGFPRILGQERTVFWRRVYSV